MATYIINEITLPNEDSCLIKDGTKLPESSYNYIINSLPYEYGGVKKENSWYFSSNPSSSATRGVADGYFYATIDATCTRFQIHKYDYLQSEHFGGVDFSDFHDGDPVMISFEYISDAAITNRNACIASSFDGSASVNSYAGDEKSLPATSIWKRVWSRSIIPEGWDSIYPNPNNVNITISFNPTGATNLKVRRISLTKSREQDQWLPNPQDVAGDYNHYNYLVNSLPRAIGAWTRIGGDAKSNTGTGTSCSFYEGWYEAKCTSYDSSLSFGSQRSQCQFFSQYSTSYTYPAVGGCIFSGWNDGDPFTLSVEMKSASDFYVTGRPIARAESGGTVISSWGTLEHTQIVHGDGKWHRIWISGIIPDGFMAVASTTANAAGIIFTFIFTANQSILARKFTFTKGLQRTDWIPGMMDTPGRMQWVDETTETNYTIGSGNYLALTKPSALQFSGVQLVKVIPLSWGSNSGMFDIITYNDTSNPTIGAYIVGPANATITSLRLRWYYMFDDVTGTTAAYS